MREVTTTTEWDTTTTFYTTTTSTDRCHLDNPGQDGTCADVLANSSGYVLCLDDAVWDRREHSDVKKFKEKLVQFRVYNMLWKLAVRFLEFSGDYFFTMIFLRTTTHFLQ